MPALAFAGAPQRDSLSARRWWLAALDREAVLDLDSAYTLLRRARDSDPLAFDIHQRYVFAAIERRGARAVADEYRRLRHRGGVYPCLAASVAADDWSRPPGIIPTLEAIVRAGDPGGCAAFQVAYARSIPGFGGPRGSFDARGWANAIDAVGRSGIPWELYGRTADRLAGPAAGDAIFAAGVRRVAHPVDRIRLLALFAARLESRGDTGRARLMRRQAEAEARSDGRLGPRVALLLERAAVAQRGSAEPLLVRALSLLPPSRAGTRAFSIREWLGNLRFDAGDVAGAVPWYRAALALADAHDLVGPRPPLLVRLGRSYARMGRVAPAERVLRRAIAELDPGARYTRADAHHQLAHVLETRGRFTAALREFDRCIELSAPLTGDGLSIIALRDAATLRAQLGMRHAAQPLYEEMVRRIDARGQYQYWAGEYFEREGRLRRALRYYVAVPITDTEEGARAAAGRVRIFEALGLLDSAAAAAAEHDRAVPAPELARQLPRVYAHRRQWGAATAAAREWVDVQRRHADLRGESLARLELGEILLASGDAQAASAEAASSLRIAREAGLRVERARSELLLGRASSASDPAGGLRRLSAAGAHARQLGEVELFASAELERARLLGREGRWRESIDAYGSAASAVERRGAALGDEFDRARHQATQSAVYEGALALLMDSVPGRADLLIRWSSRRKMAAYARPAGQAGQAAREALPRIQAALPRDAALIDFVVLSRGDVVALVVTRAAARLVRLPASRSTVDSLVRRLRESIAPTYLGRVDVARLAFDTLSSRRLAGALLTPIEHALPLPPRLLIVPDGALSLLPFDALVLPSEGPAPKPEQFAVDRYEIGYLSAATAPLPAESYARRPLLGVSANAPAAREEIAAIAREWKSAPLAVLRGAAATEEVIAARVPPHGIVHFATHAEAAEQDPGGSFIQLSGGGGGAAPSRDGFLHASEAASAEWRGALVVLSGCETLVGPALGGGGVLGLSRAFLAGGASSVVATQWPIGPSAAVLMGRFYRELAANRPPAQALRAAKRWARSQPGLAAPFHWAGFVWVGRT